MPLVVLPMRGWTQLRRTRYPRRRESTLVEFSLRPIVRIAARGLR